VAIRLGVSLGKKRRRRSTPTERLKAMQGSGDEG
jgi:hypothetical protein